MVKPKNQSCMFFVRINLFAFAYVYDQQSDAMIIDGGKPRKTIVT